MKRPQSSIPGPFFKIKKSEITKNSKVASQFTTKSRNQLEPTKSKEEVFKKYYPEGYFKRSGYQFEPYVAPEYSQKSFKSLRMKGSKSVANTSE